MHLSITINILIYRSMEIEIVVNIGIDLPPTGSVSKENAE